MVAKQEGPQLTVAMIDTMMMCILVHISSTENYSTLCPCSCLQTFMLSPSTSFSTDPMTRCPHEVTQHVRRRPPGLQRSVAHIESAGIAPATLAERLVALVSGLPDVSDKQQAATRVKWSTLSALLRLA